jgi:vacuolar protein sorting-associated protein 13A/C
LANQSKATHIDSNKPISSHRDEAQQQEKAAEQHLVAIDFSIASIALQLGLILEDKLQPVVEVSLNEVNLNFSQSNWKMVVGLELQSLQVEDLFAGKDTDKSTKFLVDSGIVSDEDKLIAITYVGTPKNSIAYNKIDHKFVLSYSRIPLCELVICLSFEICRTRVDVRFNTLTINVNRLTVATLLQIATTLTAPAAGGSDVQASVQEMQDDVVDDQSNPASADEDSIWATPPAEFDFSLAVVKVAIKSVAINLNKEMATFMKLELGRATVDVDVRGDTTMAVSGRVGTLSLREVSDQPRLWGDMISIASDKMIDFHYETFSDNNPKASLAYKGHDMAVTLNIGSMRFVFISRILKELTIYFGAFAKMQEMVKAAASYYYSASIDAVQASAKTTSTAKFSSPPFPCLNNHAFSILKQRCYLISRSTTRSSLCLSRQLRATPFPLTSERFP